MRARLHCNRHPGRLGGAAGARERDECGATAAAEEAIGVDSLCMGTRRTRWDRTDRGTDDHTGSHSHLIVSVLSSVQRRRPLRLPECTAAVRPQRTVTDGVDMTADLRIDAPLLPPLLVQRDACPSLLLGEAGEWRGRRRRGGGSGLQWLRRWLQVMRRRQQRGVRTLAHGQHDAGVCDAGRVLDQVGGRRNGNGADLEIARLSQSGLGTFAFTTCRTTS